jgi:hypothetical protein
VKKIARCAGKAVNRRVKRLGVLKAAVAVKGLFKAAVKRMARCAKAVSGESSSLENRKRQ